MPSSRLPSTPRSHVGVIVPAHDEAAAIDPCLRALERAANHARRAGLQVRIHVVCDACSDDTAARVAAHGLTPLVIDARNVGTARSTGARAAICAGAQWLAFTDADTVVSKTWIADQLDLSADAVCGTIGIDDWGTFGEALREPLRDHFAATYRDVDDHRHIHGANFGISTDAYLQVGGFQSLASSEDVALVEALMAAGLQVAWSATPRVTTSARAGYRAPGGFGYTLERVASALRERVSQGGVMDAVPT